MVEAFITYLYIEAMHSDLTNKKVASSLRNDLLSVVDEKGDKCESSEASAAIFVFSGHN